MRLFMDGLMHQPSLWFRWNLPLIAIMHCITCINSSLQARPIE